MQVTNPYTLESVDVVESDDPTVFYSEAAEAFPTWSMRTVRDRVTSLRKAYDALVAKRHELVMLMAVEMGKPIVHGEFEFDRTLEEFEYLLSNAESFLANERLPDAEVQFAPLGVVAVISPWNFPLLLPLRGIVPALVAGNSVICKPSELSPRVAVAFSKIFEGVAPFFLAVGGKELGAKLVQSPLRAIAFTGSTAVGKAIAREAATSFKRVILELGGLDAAIVLPDADVERAAREIVRANVRNSGQVCNAAKRALVHQGIYDRFVTHAIAASKELRYGDPTLRDTEVGPLVSKFQWERVKGFLDDAVEKGAIAHQVALERQGYIFPQVILTHVPDSARLLREEPFGPLLPVIPFSSEEQAVRIANGTSFGLTASVWTNDAQAARRIAEQLDVGLVRQNTHAAMRAGIPWGGAKESGIGRMKTKEGLREFTNVRVVSVESGN